MVNWVINWVKANPGKALAITNIISASTGNVLPSWVGQVFNIVFWS